MEVGPALMCFGLLVRCRPSSILESVIYIFVQFLFVSVVFFKVIMSRLTREILEEIKY